MRVAIGVRQENVGGLDRVARLVVGPVLLACGLAALGGRLTLGLDEMRQLVGGGIGVVLGVGFAVTGVTRRCPVNRALGVDTHRGRGETAADEPVGEKPRIG